MTTNLQSPSTMSQEMKEAVILFENRLWNLFSQGTINEEQYKSAIKTLLEASKNYDK